MNAIGHEPDRDRMNVNNRQPRTEVEAISTAAFALDRLRGLVSFDTESEAALARLRADFNARLDKAGGVRRRSLTHRLSEWLIVPANVCLLAAFAATVGMIGQMMPFGSAFRMASLGLGFGAVPLLTAAWGLRHADKLEARDRAQRS